MSLNKTLDRLFNEIRREARRNADFADRLDAILRAHLSSRDVPEDLIAEARADQDKAPPSPAGAGEGGVQRVERTQEESRASQRPLPLPPPQAEGARPAGRAKQKKPPAKEEVPQLNPVGLLQREGAEALENALEKFDRAALIALVAEHNLDPGGEAGELDREALAAHILAQAAARMERDRKLFDY